MTISLGEPRTASDLNGSQTTILSNLSTDNRTLPALYWLNLRFDGLVSSTALVKRTRSIVIADDQILVEVAVSSGEHDGYLSADISNGAMIEPLVMSEVQSAGFDKMARWNVSIKSQAPAIQLILLGSQLQVIVESLNTTTPSAVNVSLGFSSEWRRS